MKELAFLGLLLLFPLLTKAQKSPIYLSFEGGGSGIIASANVGKPLFFHPRYKVIVQTGLGWAPAIAKPVSPFNIPFQLSFNFGQNGSYFETGVGLTLIPKSRLRQAFDAAASPELYISPVLGFRHESDNWFGRVYACPLYHLSGEHIHDPVTKDFIKFGIGIGAIL